MEIIHLTLKHPNKDKKTFTFNTEADARARRWDSGEDSHGYYHFLTLTSEMDNLINYLELEDIKWNNFPGIMMTDDDRYFIDTLTHKTDKTITELEIFPINVNVEWLDDDDDENC